MFSLGAADLARFRFGMVVLLTAANLLGYIAERLTIPRVIGEVAGGLSSDPRVWEPSFHRHFIGYIRASLQKAVCLG